MKELISKFLVKAINLAPGNQSATYEIRNIAYLVKDIGNVLESSKIYFRFIAPGRELGGMEHPLKVSEILDIEFREKDSEYYSRGSKTTITLSQKKKYCFIRAVSGNNNFWGKLFPYRKFFAEITKS